MKNDFWIVKDNFESDKPRTYKQIWQGHYTKDKTPNLLRSTFSDGSGSDIYQLISVDSISISGTRGKEWAVVSKNNKNNFNFITAIFPFSKYDNKIEEDKINPNLKGWEINNSEWKIESKESTTLSKDSLSLFFSVKKLEFKNTKILFSEVADVFIKLENKIITIQSINDQTLNIDIFNHGEIEKFTLFPGNEIFYTIKN